MILRDLKQKTEYIFCHLVLHEFQELLQKVSEYAGMPVTTANLWLVAETVRIEVGFTLSLITYKN